MSNNIEIINCPNCRLDTRAENIHQCRACETKCCPYCESRHWFETHDDYVNDSRVVVSRQGEK